MVPLSKGQSPRKSVLGPAEVRLLDDWGRSLRDTFDAMPFLVGSTMQGKKDYRDIDVRIMLDDEVYDKLAEVIKPRRLNLMLTLWGRTVTGLPIDCQIQRLTEANTKYGGLARHPRNPLGLRDSEGTEGA